MRSVALPPVNEREVLRYAGVRGVADENTLRLLAECVKEGEAVVAPKTCFRVLTREELFSLVAGARESRGLKAALGESENVLLFGCTLGLGVDRLLHRYATVAPSKALLLQAYGAERIEALCDEFCRLWQEQNGKTLSQRFSAGYGDFPLRAQRDIFQVLDCARSIGLTLTEGLMMSPTKSVTAFVGIGGKACRASCVECKKKDCEYRV